jgi:hypothetical protein
MHLFLSNFLFSPIHILFPCKKSISPIIPIPQYPYLIPTLQPKIIAIIQSK